MAKFDRLPKKYTFVLHLLRRSSVLKSLVPDDKSRKELIECMYDMSRHTLYKLLKDYSTDPFNSRFELNSSPNYVSLASIEKFELRDKTNNILLCISNYNGSTEKYNPKYIKCNAYINGKYTSDVLTENEKLYFLRLHEDVRVMIKNFDELEKYQKINEVKDELKRLY